MNTYVMVGAGGTGSHLFRALVAYLTSHHGKDDPFQLVVVDGDSVEKKNLERQLFMPEEVTLNKAAALCMGMENNIYPMTEYLSEDNIAEVVQDGDTVLICVDNFTVRKRIEDHVLTLQNAVVINAGNEKHSGSVQLWVREDGVNVTPPLSFLHPEVRVGEGDDRAEMTCAQAAALPGGEQTIVANAQAATWMLTMLWRYHTALCRTIGDGHELQFDAVKGDAEMIDYRSTKAWAKYV